MNKDNHIKRLLELLRKDNIISELEYNKIWKNYKIKKVKNE